MFVAAYLVGGFLVASVYAAGWLRGARPLPPPRFPHRVLRRCDRHTGPDARRRPVGPLGVPQRALKFAAIELVPETTSDVPETLFGHLNDDGDGQRRDPDPRAGVVALGPVDGTGTVIQGLDEFPADPRPTTAEVNTVHLAWDVMVGSAPC